MGAMESKAALKRNVFRLYEGAEAIPTDEGEQSYWSSFLTLPTSAEDVHSLFAAREARALVSAGSAGVRSNLRTLVQRVGVVLLRGDSRVRLSCLAPFLPLGPEGHANGTSRLMRSRAPYDVQMLEHLFTFRDRTARPSNQDCAQALNAVRILVRLLPFLLSAAPVELGADGSTAISPEEELFWDEREQGAQLLETLVRLLFYQGFTLSTDTDDASPNLLEDVVWQAGIATPVAPPTVRENLEARAELLRLLLACLSKPLYAHPAQVLEVPDRWRDCLLAILSRQLTLLRTFALSLLNTVLAYRVPSALVLLAPALLSSHREQENVCTLSLQLLLVLLDQRGGVSASSADAIPTSPPVGNANPPEAGAAPTLVPPAPTLVTFIAGLDQVDALLEGMRALLLANPAPKFQVAFVMLLWELMILNEPLALAILDSPHFHVLLVTLLTMLYGARSEPHLASVFRHACFLLHHLSGRRAFGERLNEPLNRAVFSAPSATTMLQALPSCQGGTYGDLYILLLHSVTTTCTLKANVRLLENLLISLANAAPYIASLHMTAAGKLVALLHAFAHPAFLLSSPLAHRLLYYLLEVCNSLLQHQTLGSLPLVYVLVQSEPQILALRDLTWSVAEAAVTRVARQREAGASAAAASAAASPAGDAPSDSPSPTSTTGITDETATNASTDSEGQASPASSALSTAAATSASALSPTASVGSRPAASFIPDERWFTEWKHHLPLHVLLALLEHVRPMLVRFFAEREDQAPDERQALAFLRSKTLVGLLPLPGRIYPRLFLLSRTISVWLTCYLWSTVFSGNSAVPSGTEDRSILPPIWLGSPVRLFEVRSIR